MERDTMLGKLIGWINGLPLETLKVLYDLVEKLLGKVGKQWLAELKRFLRKEKCWTNIFYLKVDGYRTIEKLIEKGKYDWVEEYAKRDNFPSQHHSRPFSHGWVKIEFLEFDEELTTEQIIAEAKGLGYERPIHDDALLFGIQFPEEQRKQKIIFLHDLWQSPGGALAVLALDADSRGRTLEIATCATGQHKWSTRNNYKFAFVDNSISEEN